MVLANVNPRERTGRKLTKEEIKKMRDNDHKMVKGVFRHLEVPGGSLTFAFKKYPGDQVETYAMKDGEKYEVPLMVAKHLNQNCWYPKHQWLLDSAGAPIRDSGKKVKRCSFESLEFHDLMAQEEHDNAS